MNVLLTRAPVFVGRNLIARLSAQDKFIVSDSVREPSRISAGDAHVVIGDIEGDTTLNKAADNFIEQPRE
jgi:nucleoside-diphosphate-sugar epimerase